MSNVRSMWRLKDNMRFSNTVEQFYRKRFFTMPILTPSSRCGPRKKRTIIAIFPIPDLVPVLIDEPWIERVKAAQPELPVKRRDRYMQDFSLPKYDAEILTGDKAVADYYERHHCQSEIEIERCIQAGE